MRVEPAGHQQKSRKLRYSRLGSRHQLQDFFGLLELALLDQRQHQFPRVGSNGSGYYSSGDRSVESYDVTYEYAGQQYITRTNYHPGDRIRVRVDVRAE